MNLLQTALAFVVCLGSLVVCHELGHYLVARWCGVKVLRFSVGMGRVVWSRRFGPDRTEWALSMLPLGGYVKMLDIRDSETLEMGPLSPGDARREFTRQSVWRRIAIVAAGPLANFLIAIVLYAGLYIHGIEEPSSKVGVRGPAPAALLATAADAAHAAGASGAGEDARERIAGSSAWQAGLRAGDAVTAVNEHPVATWSDLRWQLIQAAVDKTEARLSVERPGQGGYHFVLPAAVLAGFDVDGDVLDKLGLAPARPAPLVTEVQPGGAGAAAGLRAGDLLLEVDGVPVTDGPAFIRIIRGAAGRTLRVALRRDGVPLLLAVTPRAVEEDDKEGKGTVTVGKIATGLAMRPDMINVRSSPLAAVGKAVQKVWDTSAMTLKMIGKMVTGDISLKHVTGPIAIADYAGQTARLGMTYYLSFIAFFSISLGVMNLLPIPVLDGGHLLYYSLEVLTGRPVPERFGEMAQRFGMGLLLALMLLAMFNDISQRI